MLTNVMYVTLYVTDQDRSLRFYTEQLGLEKRIDFTGPDGRFLTVGVPGGPVELILWPDAGAFQPFSRATCSPTRLAGPAEGPSSARSSGNPASTRSASRQVTTLGPRVERTSAPARRSSTI